MNFLLVAKGADVTAWRAVENYNSAYRQALLDLASSDRTDSVESVFSETCAKLEAAITTHNVLLKRLNSLIEDVSTTSQDSLRELTEAFYTDLYQYFEHFHSSQAFYQLSMAFLKRVSTSIIAQTIDKLGLSPADLPQISLVAVGSAGRCEYSPFCQLQILIIHGDASDQQHRSINMFCDSLHAGFEAAGMPVDPMVTPRDPRWRGTLAEWQQRCEIGLRPQTHEEYIYLCRLVDLCPLNPGDELSLELKMISSAALNGSRAALTNLIERMLSISNGLGLMGGLKLDRKGGSRGKFRLQDHGLLPLSVALSALALIRKITAVSSCERIQELLKRGEVDVEMAERMLVTWHKMNYLRLCQEKSFHTNKIIEYSLFLDPNDMSAEERQSLKETLESVAIIQRHVEITFSGMGD